MPEVIVMGEVMLELSSADLPQHPHLKALGYAGDTYNTAVYLARLGVATGYFTRVGDDTYSHAVIANARKEGIDASGIEQVHGRVLGLYMIENVEGGERLFTYWRGQSPARDLLGSPEQLASFQSQLDRAEMLYISGITLAIMSDHARDRLLSALEAFRQRGGSVAFDSNYRPRLWQNKDQTQQAMRAMLKHTDIALLTDEDELQLWGDAHPHSVLERTARAGVREIVLKRGPRDVVASKGGTPREHLNTLLEVPVPPVSKVVDTTAAGDSFNAAYLAARLEGKAQADCVRAGIRCAGIVIQHRGAIVERDLFLQSL